MVNPPVLSGAAWRKSSYSGGSEAGSCIEIADGYVNLIPVRDSKDPSGPALTFTAAAWASFVAEVKAGAFPA